MTFHIFSRWLPSAILNFEKFKFWINFRGRSQNLPEKKKVKTGQQRKKAQQRNISHGKAPANDTVTKFGTGADVQDIITHAKLQGESL